MKSKELKNIIIFTVAVIFITIGVGVGTFSILKYVDDKLQSKSMNQLLSQAIEEDVSKINWEKLNKINEDIVGWIQIENTDINYPILYNNKIDYLKHSYNKKYNLNGSICTNNNLDFEENETVLYGVDIENNMMFSDLKEFLKEDFCKSHNIFYIYTPENNYKATIISSYEDREESKKVERLGFEDKVNYYKKNSDVTLNTTSSVNNIVKLCSFSYRLDSLSNCVIASIEKITN